MNIVANSAISQLGSYDVSIGPTGPTGPIGPTGFRGPGLTGNTGANVIGITLINRQIFTTFINGATAVASGIAIGTTGNYNYLLDYLNSGSGVSLAHSISGDVLKIRPIRISTTTNNKFLISSEPDKISVNIAPKTISGLTLRNLVNEDTNSYLVSYNNTRFIRTRIAPQKFSNTGVGIEMSNLFERVRGMGWTGSTGAVYCVSSPSGITCTVNPFVYENDEHMFNMRSKTFIGDFEGNTASIVIPACPTTDNTAYSFEMYIYNAKNPTNLSERFISASPIKWPQNNIPCFSTSFIASPIPGITVGNCDLRVTFFGLNGAWYATTKVLGITCSGTAVGAPVFSLPTCQVTVIPFTTGTNRQTDQEGQFFFPTYLYTLSTDSSILGACCKSDGTCSITNAYLCDGFFHGYGTTCGSTTDSICNKIGACCIDSGYGSSVRICEDLSCTECIGITGSIYGGNDSTCYGISCSDLTKGVGACCDGLGGCEQLSEIQCLNKDGFYQGNNSDCFKNNIAVCSSGTGPCCINGACNSTNADECFTNNGYFLGKGRSCGEFECPNSVSCLGYINGVALTPGQYYGGGLIVGKFEPGKSQLLGASSLFDPQNINVSVNGITYTSEYYTSFLDHTAYGITKNCAFDNESYIIVVYPRDLSVDEELEFAWGGTGSSWGPILDSGGNCNDFVLRLDPNNVSSSPINYLNTHIAFNEGYWSTGITLINSSVIANTFQTCASSTVYGTQGVERVFAKSPYGLHGVWHHSWGLYNTARAIHAHNTYNKQTTVSPVFTWQEYTVSSGLNAFDSIRTISDGITSSSQGITANSSALSGWYLPSHDEMAFIAANTSSSFGFNVNQALMLTPNGQPLNGTYWTSTGTFDYTKNEGIRTGSNKPNPGTVAISMYMDVNGSDYKVIKHNRQTKLKVRPIRMIRCDSNIPANRYLWLLPSVLSDSSNTNQRDIDTLDIGIP